LCCDAYGVLPPVAKLSQEQAIYYYLSGYTAKIPGTECGIKDPEATFSACFGEAFLPLDPLVYANLLYKKIRTHNIDIYMINTGWTGGSFGIGKRMSVEVTRACIRSILSEEPPTDFVKDDIFQFMIPITINSLIDISFLQPENTWEDKSLYNQTKKLLASKFVENFKKYKRNDNSIEFSKYGPIP
jgi:phosphoenolpyruvate carboxykinase (ATP)